ncbi:uncharacterized protein LOC135391677 [Ornithodoros turicata]|uniref:uncharacterized protein LOC135391677 n=1 Tax=Ornithodoros turicata TaxID=34597 RepID=UPI003139A443
MKQQAEADDEPEEPIFRPLRRNNWAPFRRRPPLRLSRDITCSFLDQSDHNSGDSWRFDGGCENCAFSSTSIPAEAQDTPRRECPERCVSGEAVYSGTLARNRHETPVAATRLDGHQPPVPHEVLPDILNAHLPPPYATLPPRRLLPPPPRLRPPRCVVDTEVVEPKHCCGVLVTQTVSIRWFIVMIAFVGLCCAIVGTVLGALKATGREHLTVSLLMIGVGIVLITVSGIAWRLTSHEAPSCRAMLGLRPDEPNRRFVPRVPPYGRPSHPYAAMMYPEFQYRPPPPSYQASMQEYRLRLLLLDRGNGGGGPPPGPHLPPTHSSGHPPGHQPPPPSTALSPVSPPPTYRSHAGAGTLHARPPLTLPEREYSRPPSYRSRTSSAGGILRSCVGGDTSRSQDTLASQSPASPTPATPPSALHSRNPSLTLSTLSQENETQEVPPPMSREANHRPKGELLRKNHDVNTVTIVQTTDTSQVINQDTVIVSVSGQNARTLVLPSGHSEVQVTLAHV